MTEQISNPLRELANDAIKKSMFATAGFIAEQVVRGPDVRMSDLIVFAKNQPRRCLAALEQRGLLSAHNTQLLSTSLLTSNSDSLLSTETTPLSRSDFIDLVSAFQLAARCLFSLQEYEDCVTLLGPLVSLDIDLDSEDCHLVGCRTAVSRAKALFQPVDESECNTSEKHAPSSSSGPTAAASMEINPMSGIYNMIGQCYDQLDNRPRAIKALVAALTVDSACTEAAEYLVSHGLLSPSEKKSLLTVSLDLTHGRAWLESYYRFILLGEPPGSAAATEKKSTLMEGPSAGVCQVSWEPSSAEWMARNAEILYDRMLPEESYRLARQAYNLDPFGPRGLLVYIACLLQLKMKTELFYLGHELSSAYPKIAMSWYAVGCYYLCCNKPEAAQKHLQRATKIDKRFAKAWVALGQSLSAQEESEHAIAAYRAACRLLPGDHRPMVLMAKELVRTNYLSLALHLLTGAIHISPRDPVVLNEIGVIYVRLERLDEALSHLSQAVSTVDLCSQHSKGNSGIIGGIGSSALAEEIFSNYATALRKSDRLEEALSWYDRCLCLSPSDPNTHASIAFTLHLMRRFDDAVSAYHRALALQPTFTFCIDMLNRAMVDSCEHFAKASLNLQYNDSRTINAQEGNDDGDVSFDIDACGLSVMLGASDSSSFLQDTS